MSTLSLDLRGSGANQPLPRESKTRGAGVSFLIHGALVSAMVLVPLIGSSTPPEAAGIFHRILVQPIAVAPPPPPVTGSRTPRAASSPRPVQAAVSPVDVPKVVPVSIDVGDVLDPEIGPGSEARTGDQGSDLGRGGDCLLGALCGTAPLPAADVPVVVVVGGMIKEPRLIDSRPPQYPSVAQAAGVSGRVRVQAHVGRDGRVRDASILEGHPLFDAPALSSVRSRRYEPLLLNGVPNEFLVTVTVVFSIKR